MLRKDVRTTVTRPAARAKSSADPAQVERFNRLADEWWKPDGVFKVVHAFNRARVEHLRYRLPLLMERDPGSGSPLEGLSLLDVGCGPGIVTEPLSELGAVTLGIDAAERNVLVAQRHAVSSAAPVSYRHAVPEDLVSEGVRYDVVISLEVVEHVADVPQFLAALAALVAPGGLLVIGTINRTATSFAKAIVGAEYLLRWLPRGTHDWRRFVTPAELDRQLSGYGFATLENCGVDLNLLTSRWHISRSVSSIYLQIHRAPPFVGWLA